MERIPLILAIVVIVLIFSVAIVEFESRIEAFGLVHVTVLHVSTNLQNEAQRIVENVSMAHIFTITQVSLSDFNSGIPSNLYQFDVIVFGMNDGGESRGPYSGVYGRALELENFVESGGGIVWTHDTLEYIGDYGTDIEGPAGVDNRGGTPHPTPYADIEHIRIICDHPLLHEPFEIGNVGDLISKTPNPSNSYDHTTGGWVTTATILIEHADPSTLYNFYLTVNEYAQGRVAVIELGHSMGDYGRDLVSTRENKILVNAMYWAANLPLAPSVGGEWVPIDKLQLLAPWISSVSLLTMVAASFVCVKRKKKQQN